MTRPISKSFLIILLIATAIGVLISAKSLLMPTLYYPYLSITLPGNIRIQTLQRGQTQPSRCARVLASQVTAITGICPMCQIESTDCRVDLDNPEQQWLEDEPLTAPSARMAYGVLLFDAPQEQLALATC